MIEEGILRWSNWDVARALQLPVGECADLMRNSRLLSSVIEHRLVHQYFIGSSLAPNNAPYDLLTKSGSRAEVRSITKQGVHFAPSYMRGSGRSFDRKRFEERLDQLNLFILVDTTSYPSSKFWVLDADVVHDWWDNGDMSASATVSRRNLFKLIDYVKEVWRA